MRSSQGMSVSRLTYITKIGVEQMGDLSNMKLSKTPIWYLTGLHQRLVLE